jgi:hypothetical protein
VATLSGEHDVHIVIPGFDAEFRGQFLVNGNFSPSCTGGCFAPMLVLTQVGGADDGKVRSLIYDDGPG